MLAIEAPGQDHGNAHSFQVKSGSQSNVKKADIIFRPKHQKMEEALWCGPWFYQMVSCHLKYRKRTSKVRITWIS